jgi:hypothetical protein
MRVSTEPNKALPLLHAPHCLTHLLTQCICMFLCFGIETYICLCIAIQLMFVMKTLIALCEVGFWNLNIFYIKFMLLKVCFAKMRMCSPWQISNESNLRQFEQVKTQIRNDACGRITRCVKKWFIAQTAGHSQPRALLRCTQVVSKFSFVLWHQVG